MKNGFRFFELLIALRYFNGRNSLLFIKVINYISIIGVMIGVTTLIVVIGVMNGFDDYLQSKIIGVTSHISVADNSGKYIEDYEALITELTKIDGIEAASPAFSDNVLLRTEYGTLAAGIKGVLPECDKNITKIFSSLIDGQENYISSARGIFIGVYLARRLGLKKSDYITVIPAQITYSAFGIMPGVKNLEILGIFKTGMFEYDNSFVYAPLAVAQSLFKRPNAATNIEIKLKDMNRAGDIAAQINTKFQYRYYATSWMAMNRSLFAALKLEKTVMFIILTLIIAVAALNIASSIIVLIVEKTKEIGILRAMGLSQRGIARIFLFKGLIIGIIGAGAGLIFGLLLSYIVSRYKITIPGDVYYIERLPIKTEMFDVSIICITAIVICIAASVYPALRASKLASVEAIRNE